MHRHTWRERDGGVQIAERHERERERDAERVSEETWGSIQLYARGEGAREREARAREAREMEERERERGRHERATATGRQQRAGEREAVTSWRRERR